MAQHESSHFDARGQMLQPGSAGWDAVCAREAVEDRRRDLRCSCTRAGRLGFTAPAGRDGLRPVRRRGRLDRHPHGPRTGQTPLPGCPGTPWRPPCWPGRVHPSHCCAAAPCRPWPCTACRPRARWRVGWRTRTLGCVNAPCGPQANWAAPTWHRPWCRCWMRQAPMTMQVAHGGCRFAVPAGARTMGRRRCGTGGGSKCEDWCAGSAGRTSRQRAASLAQWPHPSCCRRPLSRRCSNSCTGGARWPPCVSAARRAGWTS